MAGGYWWPRASATDRVPLAGADGRGRQHPVPVPPPLPAQATVGAAAPAGGNRDPWSLLTGGGPARSHGEACVGVVGLRSPPAVVARCAVARGPTVGLGACVGHTGPQSHTGPESRGRGSSGREARYCDTRGSTRPGGRPCTDRGDGGHGHAAVGVRGTSGSGGSATRCAD
jgi:hypothetical protein